ncbi:MAG: alpha/beta hydrolase [Betaproteobacteria bacterium]|nr:alpha/beta hydrolase [Betaproteobacteria bacterium]
MTSTPPIRFLQIDGHRLEYQLFPAKRADLPTLVLLHQGLGSLELWRDFPSQVADQTGCAALVYSRYGYGRSEVIHAARKPDFLVHEGAIVLPELIATLGIDGVILIGHSDGGTAALAYAGKGHRARALVVVAPHIRDEAATQDAIQRHLAAWPTGVLRARMARYHDDVDRMFLAWANVWPTPENAGWTIEPLLPNITCPILAIQGADDDHGTMTQIDQIAALARGPVTLEKWPQCGHDPFRDQPDHALTVITAFVASIAAT